MSITKQVGSFLPGKLKKMCSKQYFQEKQKVPLLPKMPVVVQEFSFFSENTDKDLLR